MCRLGTVDVLAVDSAGFIYWSAPPPRSRVGGGDVDRLDKVDRRWRWRGHNILLETSPKFPLDLLST